jgi:uncharacterized protein YjbI with pentapeptide repeats
MAPTAPDTPVDPAVFTDLPRLDALDGFVDHGTLENVRLSGERGEIVATRLSLDTVRCDGVRIAGARLPRLLARTTWWEDCDLSNCDLGDSTVRHAVLRRSRLTGLAAAQASWRDVLVEDCKLDLANFRFAKLERVVFRRCVLADADFGGSEQRHVRFDGCDLRAAQLWQSKLDNVDLRGSQLEGLGGLVDLRGARISTEQLLELAPALAGQLGIRVED